MIDSEDISNAKARPEVWVMRQAIIDLTKAVVTLQAEVEDLKKQSANANAGRIKFGLAVVIALGIGFFVLQESLDSLPGSLMRQMTTDSPFRAALCR